MSSSSKSLRAVLASAVVAGALLSVGAGSAFGAYANWTPAGNVKEIGTLTLKLNGGSPVTCSFNGTGGTIVPVMIAQQTSQPCSNGGTLSGRFHQIGQNNGGAYSVDMRSGGGGFVGPHGPFWAASVILPFNNGNVSTPSTIVLNDAIIGADVDGGWVTATGTLTVTTPTGGLVTLN